MTAFGHMSFEGLLAWLSVWRGRFEKGRGAILTKLLKNFVLLEHVSFDLFRHLNKNYKYSGLLC